MESFLSLFGVCCKERDTDENKSERDSVNVDSKPLDFIRTRPGLVKVLKWFG